jgi:hypothetical protein
MSEKSLQQMGMVIGVPIVSFIANTASIEMAMFFFTIVDALVFIATLIK